MATALLIPGHPIRDGSGMSEVIDSKPHSGFVPECREPPLLGGAYVVRAPTGSHRTHAWQTPPRVRQSPSRQERALPATVRACAGLAGVRTASGHRGPGCSGAIAEQASMLPFPAS